MRKGFHMHFHSVNQSVSRIRERSLSHKQIAIIDDMDNQQKIKHVINCDHDH